MTSDANHMCPILMYNNSTSLVHTVFLRPNEWAPLAYVDRGQSDEAYFKFLDWTLLHPVLKSNSTL